MSPHFLRYARVESAERQLVARLRLRGCVFELDGPDLVIKVRLPGALMPWEREQVAYYAAAIRALLEEEEAAEFADII